MERPTVGEKRRLLIYLLCCMLAFLVLIGRLAYIGLLRSSQWQEMAYEQQTRDRLITARRGDILDRNGVGIAETQTVAAVSVVPAEVKEKEETAKLLADTLELDYDDVLEKVQQKVALVRIQSKVDTETAQAIRQADLPGVKVDEDVQRIYPFGELAAQVVGFVGKDNQGIIGLEAKYDDVLEGEQGKILTLTDAKGKELSREQERIPPVDGGNLVTTLDVTIQQYAEQTLAKTVESKQAKKGSLIVMNPQNGEIYAMANYPSFDLNEPFTINNPELAAAWEGLSSKEQSEIPPSTIHMSRGVFLRSLLLWQVWKKALSRRNLLFIAGDSMWQEIGRSNVGGIPEPMGRKLLRKVYRIPVTRCLWKLQSGWVRKPFWIMWKNLASGKKQALTWQGKLRESSMN